MSFSLLMLPPICVLQPSARAPTGVYTGSAGGGEFPRYLIVEFLSSGFLPTKYFRDNCYHLHASPSLRRFFSSIFDFSLLSVRSVFSAHTARGRSIIRLGGKFILPPHIFAWNFYPQILTGFLTSLCFIFHGRGGGRESSIFSIYISLRLFPVCTVFGLWVF